ncbi:hypothetical protein AB5I41_08400 [Sphingomonas sp. MMS24-JH45]
MLVDVGEEDWDAVIHVHLKGTFRPHPPRRQSLATAPQGG